jgi:hypothetical protein
MKYLVILGQCRTLPWRAKSAFATEGHAVTCQRKFHDRSAIRFPRRISEWPGVAAGTVLRTFEVLRVNRLHGRHTEEGD